MEYTAGGRSKKLILATYIVFQNLGCHTCTDQMKIERGCKQDLETPRKWPMFGTMQWELKRCFVKEVKPKSWEYINAYTLYKSGHFPNEGGWLNQGHKYMEMMKIIDHQMGELQKMKAMQDKMRLK